MKARHFVLALLGLLLLASCGEKVDNTLKVISFNIRMGIAEDGENSWENRRDASVAMVKEQLPDIIGLQEAYPFQDSYITANIPGYACIGVGRDDGQFLGERMSIVFNYNRVKPVKYGTFWLSETPDVPSFGWDAKCRRTATWARMTHLATGKEFFFVNTHLDHKGEVARREGLALIESKIADMNPEGLPVILTGDFNLRDNNPLILEFDQRMNNAREKAAVTDTLCSSNGYRKDRGNRIDYIFYNGFRKCTEFHTLTGEYAGKPYISDHYPVCAVLVFKK